MKTRVSGWLCASTGIQIMLTNIKTNREVTLHTSESFHLEAINDASYGAAIVHDMCRVAQSVRNCDGCHAQACLSVLHSSYCRHCLRQPAAWMEDQVLSLVSLRLPICVVIKATCGREGGRWRYDNLYNSPILSHLTAILPDPRSSGVI